MRDSQGSFSIALGAFAATSKITGDYNAYLGYAVGASQSNTESFTIRIGDSGAYTRHFAGVIRGVTTGAANAVAVVIDSNGQLGTVSSSRRYKQDIQDMGDASSALMRLRPVTYRYTRAYRQRRPADRLRAHRRRSRDHGTAPFAGTRREAGCRGNPPGRVGRSAGA